MLPFLLLFKNISVSCRIRPNSANSPKKSWPIIAYKFYQNIHIMMQIQLIYISTELVTSSYAWFTGFEVVCQWIAYTYKCHHLLVVHMKWSFSDNFQQVFRAQETLKARLKVVPYKVWVINMTRGFFSKTHHVKPCFIYKFNIIQDNDKNNIYNFHVWTGL